VYLADLRQGCFLVNEGETASTVATSVEAAQQRLRLSDAPDALVLRAARIPAERSVTERF